ncbi:MAG: hypothetical protein CVT89_01090 [Candidatus Altiarchaeales archaeon HGW-Altiarchaeales-2]|nr:MAG: hypothetical protein CVT89_01090 [Candidatus Altiarchaeales archaeon HGW-Altiarchaeales-2]
MDLKTGILVMLVGIAIVGMMASSVSAYTYETACCGPASNVKLLDTTSYAGDYDWSTCQWNYQGGTTWWGYTDSSKNGYHPQTQNALGSSVCGRAYSNHYPYNGNVLNNGFNHVQAFAGYSSNTGQQERVVYVG